MQKKKLNRILISAILLSFIILMVSTGSCRLYRVGEEQKAEPGTVRDPENTEEKTAEVDIQDSKFSPGVIEITPGTKVTWKNSDSYSHTVTSGTRDEPAGIFDSGTISGGAIYSYTFEETGAYEYFCEFHEGMRGTIIVE
jgi:plastocyanin